MENSKQNTGILVMKHQEYENQLKQCKESGDGGGNLLGRMRPTEGIGKPIRVIWCGDEEQKSYRVGQCHDNIEHLNKKIKGQVMRGHRTISGNSDKAPHYWLMKNKMIWDISTFFFEENNVRVWGYSLYSPKDFYRRYNITTASIQVE